MFVIFFNKRIEMRVAPVLNYMELTVRFKPRAERQPCNTAIAYFLKLLTEKSFIKNNYFFLVNLQ